MSSIEIAGAIVLTGILVVAVLEEFGEALTPVEQAHRDYETGRIERSSIQPRR